MKNKALALALLSWVAISGPGCSTNSQGDDALPVYLVVSTDEYAPVRNIAVESGDALRIAKIVINSRLKNPTGVSSNFQDVKLDDWVVQWSRLDGGTKVPATEVFAAPFLVPVGGISTINNGNFMSVSAWTRAPLDQLFPFNGGIDRETGKAEIHCRMTVTFRGHTLAGQAISAKTDIDQTFIYQTTNVTHTGSSSGN